MKFIQCRACFSGQPERPAVKWHFMKHLFASIISAGKWDNIYHIIVSICWKKTCRAFALVYYYYYYYYLGFFFIRHIFPEIICQVLQRSSRKRTLWNCWCILYYSPDVCHLSCHLANSVKEVCKKTWKWADLAICLYECSMRNLRDITVSFSISDDVWMWYCKSWASNFEGQVPKIWSGVDTNIDVSSRFVCYVRMIVW